MIWYGNMMDGQGGVCPPSLSSNNCSPSSSYNLQYSSSSYSYLFLKDSSCLFLTSCSPRLNSTFSRPSFVPPIQQFHSLPFRFLPQMIHRILPPSCAPSKLIRSPTPPAYTTNWFRSCTCISLQRSSLVRKLRAGFQVICRSMSSFIAAKSASSCQRRLSTSSVLRSSSLACYYRWWPSSPPTHFIRFFPNFYTYPTPSSTLVMSYIRLFWIDRRRDASQISIV